MNSAQVLDVANPHSKNLKTLINTLDYLINKIGNSQNSISRIYDFVTKPKLLNMSNINLHTDPSFDDEYNRSNCD